jgi:small-conductance mechanosensitive channel
MLFLFVPLLIAILSFKNSESVIGVISIICFVAALVFFALFVMSDKEEFSNTAIANEGLWQRLNLIFMYMPLFIVAVKGIIKE